MLLCLLEVGIELNLVSSYMEHELHGNVSFGIIIGKHVFSSTLEANLFISRHT